MEHLEMSEPEFYNEIYFGLREERIQVISYVLLQIEKEYATGKQRYIDLFNSMS